MYSYSSSEDPHEEKKAAVVANAGLARGRELLFSISIQQIGEYDIAFWMSAILTMVLKQVDWDKAIHDLFVLDLCRQQEWLLSLHGLAAYGAALPLVPQQWKFRQSLHYIPYTMRLRIGGLH